MNTDTEHAKQLHDELEEAYYQPREQLLKNLAEALDTLDELRRRLKDMRDLYFWTGFWLGMLGGVIAAVLGSLVTR